MEGNVKISLDIDPLKPVPAWSPFTVDEVVVVYGRPFSTLWPVLLTCEGLQPDSGVSISVE